MCNKGGDRSKGCDFLRKKLRFLGGKNRKIPNFGAEGEYLVLGVENIPLEEVVTTCETKKFIDLKLSASSTQ